MRTESKTVGSIFLVILTILSLYLVYLLLKPLVKTVLLAVVLAILADPVFRRFLKLYKGKRGLAALSACAVVTFLILLPIGVLLTLLTLESITLYSQVAVFVEEGGVQKLMNHNLVASAKALMEKYLSYLGGTPIDIKAKLVEQVQALSGYFIASGQKIAANIAGAVGLFFILIFALYYFFTDGRRMVDSLVEASPLSVARTEKLLERFGEVTRAAFMGTFGVAAAQGFLGGIALAIVGYQGIFWGIIMTLCSFIPVVGAAIIWAPAAVILLVGGRFVAGLFIAAWGMGVISTADNFLRPFLMKGRSGLHPLVILLSILGGVPLYGMMGIILGPLTASLGLTLVGMFAEEFGHKTSAAD